MSSTPFSPTTKPISTDGLRHRASPAYEQEAHVRDLALALILEPWGAASSTAGEEPFLTDLLVWMREMNRSGA